MRSPWANPRPLENEAEGMVPAVPTCSDQLSLYSSLQNVRFSFTRNRNSNATDSYLSGSHFGS
jgi:hypothetical protein